MIDWNKTKQIYDIQEPAYRVRVCTICDECGATGTHLIARVADIIDNQLPWKCLKCHAKYKKKPELTELERKARSECAKRNWRDSDYRSRVLSSKKDSYNRDKHSEAAKKLWEDEKYRHNVISGLHKVKQKISTAAKNKWKITQYRDKMIKLFKVRSKQLWSDPDYRDKIVSALIDNPKLSACAKNMWTDEFKEKMIDLHKQLWSDPDYRRKMIKIAEKKWHSEGYRERISERSRNLWLDSAYREKQRRTRSTDEYRLRAAANRRNMPKVSSLQTTLYSILDDLGVTYYREHEGKPDDIECTIGPYSFDCVIPREGRSTLLIECQGEYWHSIKKNLTRDKAKASYIANNFSDRYEIKYLWEHEFLNFNKIVEVVKYWLDLHKFDIVDFNFDNVNIKIANKEDYKLLLCKYHYLPNAGRGGITYGAYLGSKIIAVCVFSSLVRQNLPEDTKTTRELSRLCIHPKFQKKNFASWFVSRCIKLLDKKYRKIISYCDTTFNHNGAVYKALNFELIGEVRPDYWYVSEDGWAMHKKTLYNHATKMSMKEAEYASSNGYKKVHGKKKLKFVYER